MAEIFKDLPEILKAVTDPFSLLALMVVALALVAYTTIRHSEARAKVPTSWPPLVALSIVTVAFLALGFNVLRVLSSQMPTTQNAVTDKYNLQVVFKGLIRHHELVTIPFRASSGQLNVGCGETATTSVSWNLPPGAQQVNVAAEWINTDNIRSQSQQAVVQGTTATAAGTISGRDREWTGNCPGGGHGQLALNGTYVIDKDSATETVAIGTFQSIVQAKSAIRVKIPVSQDATLSSSEILASTDRDCSKLTLALRVDSAGHATITDAALNRHVPECKLDGPEIRASVEENELKIELP